MQEESKVQAVSDLLHIAGSMAGGTLVVAGGDRIEDLKLVEAAKGISNFSAYALDFTEAETMDPFLLAFSEDYDGRTWKATSSEELVPIFKALSTTLKHQYVISYRFLNPPAGTLALNPETLIIEEVTTIDSSPLLNYVFFDEGQSDISGNYVLLSGQAESGNFAEENLSGPMDKYRNILNIRQHVIFAIKIPPTPG